MPAIVSHYLLAQRVLADLEELMPSLDIDRTAFIWGASGPDIFFCHNLRPYSTKMHNTPADMTLNFLVGYARYKCSDIAMSYALGFITHYAFDSVAHPFILYSSDVMSLRQPHKHSSVCHNELESALDSLFLRKEKKAHISGFRLQDAAPLDKRLVNTVISSVMQGTLLYLYSKETYRSDIFSAQKNWHYSLALLNDSFGLKYKFFSRAERLVHLPPLLSSLFRRDYPDIGFDPANMGHTKWINKTTGDEHSESFFDLADTAEDLSIKLISKVISGRKLTPEDCAASFSGAKLIINNTEQAYS